MSSGRNGSIEVQPICAMNKDSFAIRLERDGGLERRVGWWLGDCRAGGRDKCENFCVGEIAWRCGGVGEVVGVCVDERSRSDATGKRKG